MSNFIALYRYKVLEVHALDPQGKTDTLCGCGSNDSHSAVGTEPATLPDNPKIACEQCRQIIKFCRRYSNSDLAGKCIKRQTQCTPV